MMDETGRNVVQNFNNSGFDFDAAKVQTLDDIDVAFEGEKLTVKVGEKSEYDGAAIYFKGIDEVAAGSGNATLIGAADNENKNDAAEFFFLGGDGHDTISSFGANDTLTIEDSSAIYTYEGTTWAVEGGSWVQK